MYNLYAYVNCWTGIDVSDNKEDLKETMSDYYQKYNLCEYMIINKSKNGDDVILRTRTEEQLLSYLGNYKKPICKKIK